MNDSATVLVRPANRCRNDNQFEPKVDSVKVDDLTQVRLLRDVP